MLFINIFSVDPAPFCNRLTGMRGSYRIGIDLGGTKTEILVLSPSNEVLLRKRNPTPREEGYEAICENICQLIQEGLVCTGGDFTTGIGIPGIMDPRTEKVINANTTALIGRPLKADLERKLKHPVFMENDANCFILAEAGLGAAAGAKSAYGIIMGTGCGGGFYINGDVYRGRHGIAGEWGHISIDPAGPECWCGNRGCIETLISGTGLENQYFRLTGRRLRAPQIVDGARRGEREAERVFQQFLDDFGRALGGLISVLDPDVVVIGGGLSSIDELYTEGVNRMKKYTFHPDPDTPVLRNQLGDSAGVFGAALLPYYSSGKEST